MSRECILDLLRNLYNICSYAQKEKKYVHFNLPIDPESCLLNSYLLYLLVLSTHKKAILPIDFVMVLCKIEILIFNSRYFYFSIYILRVHITYKYKTLVGK